MTNGQIRRGFKIIWLKITLPIRFYNSLRLVRESVSHIRESSAAMQYSFRQIDTKLSLKRSVETLTDLSHFHKEIEKALSSLKGIGL